MRLETRPPNAEGRGEVVARDLVKNALRMRPDRIIVGEVRGAEALDMLQAMNTGHEGSLSTIHANSPRDALARLETMILMAGTTLPSRAMREQIASALDVVIQVSRTARRDAPRRQRHRGHRHGRRSRDDAGDLPVPPSRYHDRRKGGRCSSSGPAYGPGSPTGFASPALTCSRFSSE